MKSLFLVIITTLCFSMSSNSQNLKFGFKGGINLSSINGDDISENIKDRTGYNIGAVAQISLLETIAIQPELIYSTQGLKDFNIDYLNLPVLLKLKLAKFFSIEAGPQFGFVVNDELLDGTKPETFDLSGAVGAGIEFGSFFGQIRYNIGFTDALENFDGKNSHFQLSIGYYLFR